MKAILIAFVIGCIAGGIDVFPMIKNEKIPRFSILAIFSQWVILGLLIPFVDWDMPPMFKGLIIGVLGMIPFMVIAFYRNRKTVFKMAISAAILGALIGISSNYLIG